MGLLQLPPDQLHWLLQAVQGVTEECVRAALRKHVLPIFTGSSGRTVSIVCPARQQAKVIEGLHGLKPPFKVAQFNVEAFVDAVAPRNGFANLRAQARAAANRPKRQGRTLRK